MPTESLVVNNAKFLVIGCGSIGVRHLSNLKTLGIENILAFDVRPAARGRIEREFGVATIDDLEAAFSQGVQVALICSPTALHLPHALRAVRSNCHVFIEKPLADSLDGVDEFVQLAEARQRATLVGCNFRFEPGLLYVKKLIEGGALGKVLYAHAQFGQYLPDWHQWEDYRQGYSAQRALGGGVILDRIHEFDYLRWLLGDVNAVSAMAQHTSALEIDTEDNANILLQFSAGALGVLHLDYVRRVYGCALELVCAEGIIQWSFAEHSVRWYQSSDRIWQSVEWPDASVNAMYLAEMQHFLNVLQGKELSVNDAAQARTVLALALAAKQSAAEKRMIEL